MPKTLKRFKGAAWDQSPIFKKLYEQEYGQLGGEPYACVVVGLLLRPQPARRGDPGRARQDRRGVSLAGADRRGPVAVRHGSWSELGNPRDLQKIFSTPDYAAWRSLRDARKTRATSASPCRASGASSLRREVRSGRRVRLRRGHERRGREQVHVVELGLRDGREHQPLYKLYGWCSRIRGIEAGGAVEGLPTHTFPTDDGGVDMTCPTEIGISDRREAELARSGFMPLIHKKNTDLAAFIGAQSLHKPGTFDDPDATANAALAARLPYLFATCRFAHYLKCIVRDKVGSFKTADSMQKWLQNWVTQYVDGDPANSSGETKSRRPLAAAEVVIEEDPSSPGYYNSKFFLRPHYQLEGLTVSLRLVSKLPSSKGGSMKFEQLMAELTPKERLQPSLLDRLTDNEPDRNVEERAARALSRPSARERAPRSHAGCSTRSTWRRFKISRTIRRSSAPTLNYGIPGPVREDRLHRARADAREGAEARHLGVRAPPVEEQRARQVGARTPRATGATRSRS